MAGWRSLFAISAILRGAAADLSGPRVAMKINPDHYRVLAYWSRHISGNEGDWTAWRGKSFSAVERPLARSGLLFRRSFARPS
jgi:hypothetical protein